MSEGFLERWSRRKQQVREGEVPEEPVVVPATEEAKAPVVVDGPGPAPGLAAEGEAAEGEAEEPPSLMDAQGLTIDSDFKPFVAKNVAPEVRNVAFKKLFADPHFNVMDGLDTYIDDYSKPSPLPESILRQMASAKFLNLFEEEPEKKNPEGGAAQDMAQSQPPGEFSSKPVADAQPASQETDDHHADLRLQQDDAPRAGDARDGAG